MVLTERQKKDLNGAILEYLITEGFQKTIDTFKEEAQISSSIDTNKGLLEKKWTAVVRLQKKVMELEAQLASPVFKNASLTSSAPAIDSRMLPTSPAKCSLIGHRAPISCIAVHPVYTLLATGSEDATIKTWDYDTQQYERTLKGHTGAITGLAYDSTGNVLASCSADMSAKLWDMSTFACIKTLRGHDHTLSAVKFLPSNDMVLTCSRDNSIKCWEVSTGFCTKTFSGHSDWVRCISVRVIIIFYY